MAAVQQPPLTATASTDNNYLTVKDLRTGLSVRVPIDVVTATIPGTAFSQLKITPTIPPPEDPNDKVPIRLYDPGLRNTTVCRSKISSSVFDKETNTSRLLYRGYDVEELVEKSNYLEVAFLLIYGELPTAKEYEHWADAVMTHTYVHSELEKQMTTFRHDAHPHGMLISTIASLSTFHPESNPCLKGSGMYMMPKAAPGKALSEEEETTAKEVRSARNHLIFRILGKTPTIAANVYRHRLGRPYNHPMPNSLNYAENVLYMMDKLNEQDYKPDPRLVKILDTMFILLAGSFWEELHGEQEQGSNCSTVLMRHLMSSGVDPYTALSGAAGALFGERKSAAVIGMLEKIGKVEKIQLFLTQVKRTAGKLVGFGHRIYKKGDPRVRIAKKMAFELFDLMGKDHLAKLAIALEEAVLKDDWLTTRGMYPNVDFWSAVVFHTLRFPPDMFPVLQTVPRVSGFVANCWESLDDPDYKIFRPRQIYTGEVLRRYAAPKARRLTNVMPLLDNTTYAGSDPTAAKRRGAADPNSLAEIDNLISRTQQSLEDLNLRLVEIETGAGADGEGSEHHRDARGGIRNRVSTWVSSQLFSSPSGVGITLQLTERLRQTQSELTQLLSKQREMIISERADSAAPLPEQSSPQQHLSTPAPSDRRLSAKSPRLSSGNTTPRPIATPEPPS
ncbi:hypothetical protein HDU87_008832 [Geranomyces variabilis]|uniref:Citrate synthase n=1 Tax=Geranomyces variabilis TaxID=109894 RepID=A0AAD5TD09_9FUNG|nr:hypothetical protein HDU87_008832 [Geranomyces variabilis]